jgi:hypothetical protein
MALCPERFTEKQTITGVTVVGALVIRLTTEELGVTSLFQTLNSKVVTLHGFHWV